MGGDDRSEAEGGELGLPPTTTPPPSVRAAILANVVRQTVGGGETPLLDGRYRLLGEIGRGGAGTVWKAELLPLGRLVAVKLLRPGVASNGSAVSRLMREAMTVSQLGHEHIVKVNDVGVDEHGSPYIAMELVEGESLSQWVNRRGPLPWSEVAVIATQICDALSAAHAVGIVHRDVKPANVMATRRGDGRWRCKLLDFGLCTAGRDNPMLTAAGVLLGTPGYAAPEQIRGEVVDARADLYGLACVMAELLTGRPAFGGASRQEVVSSQLAGRRCGDLDALELPARVVALIDRGLCLHANERHDDPAAFARAIANADRTVPAQTRSADATPRPRIGWRGLLGGATMLACAGAAATVAVATGSPQPAASVASSPVSSNVAVIPQAPVEPPPHAPAAEPIDPTSQPKQNVSEALPLAEELADGIRQAPPTPARRKRVRRPAPKPQPPAAPQPPAERNYPHGIRDPFAIR